MPNYEFAYRVRKSDLLPIVIKQDKGSGRIYFAMDSIAGLRDEPYMDAEKDYLQHVEFQLSGYQGTFGGTTKTMTTWDEVTRELSFHQSFGLQLNKNIPVGADWQNKIRAMSSPYEKMSAIYNFVFKNFTWSGVGGIGSENGVKDTWEKRKGNSGDLNLMLVNLLLESGLEAYPLLVSTRGHGKVNPDIPFLDQFNKVMAYVIIDGKKYVLDAAGPYTPPFMVPFSVINTTAFIVHRKKGGIVTLTETEKQDRNLVNITAAIDENGNMKGEAFIQSHDYARLTRLRAWERDKDHFKEDYYTSYQPGLTIDSLSVMNLENDSLPFGQRFNFFIPPAASGNYKLINLNLFSGITKNPFISDIRF
ncbi:MAG TPA: transglutaminase domain-containing protein, partial [Niastella sp.]|nr:transglutaminase domain-containing protein [Niastella sp.]